MITVLAASAFLFGTPQPSLTANAVTVAQNLDLTSFANSVGPRRKPGARLPADYGFTHVDGNDSLAVLSEPDRSWELSVELISRNGDDVVICFGDDARNGGTYHSQQPLTLHKGLDGVYRALDERPQVPSCPAKS
jgi:hypothetical protein